MLHPNECYVILRKEGETFSVLNTFFPSHGITMEKLLRNANHRRQQWHDTLFRDKDVHLVIGIAGASMREGVLGNFKIIS